MTALAIVLGGILALPGSALAHLDLVDTEPRDGAALASPVERIVLDFTVAGDLVGPGIRLLDEQGAQLPADVRRTRDGTGFQVTPAAPLESGRFGVAWRVAAPDAHPKSGAFTFSVAGSTGGGSSSDPRGRGADGEDGRALEADPLAEALAAPSDRGARVVGGAGRALAFAGSLLAVGGLVFLAVAMVGTRRETFRLFALVRLAGVVAMVGGVIGLVGRAWLLEGGLAPAFSPGALLAALDGEAGASIALTIGGGALVATGARAAFRAAPRLAVGTWTADDRARVVGASMRNAVPAIAGAAMTALGAALDGHSASEDPRVLVWTADLVHTLSAGVWLGGLALLAVLLVSRRRAGRHSNAAYSSVRFSAIAGAGVGLAGVAGITLAIVIAPSPAALWTSAWGLLLMTKLALVAVAIAIGAYNHFRLVPRLSLLLERGAGPRLVTAREVAPSAPTEGVRGEPLGDLNGDVAVIERIEAPEETPPEREDEIVDRLRRHAVLELAILAAVVAVTAALVGASAG